MTKRVEERKAHSEEVRKSLCNMRILVCGKGGSGKSSVVALMANALQEKGYKVLALDGDASNPGGLGLLLFGLKRGPEPLIDFFGGREKVECPVDNPAPLTRKDDALPITERNIDLDELPSEYYLRKEGIVLLQAGKIQKACEGCHGPMSKITRDFIVKGDMVTLIDVEAGIEHFGRGVERNVDIVLTVVDPTSESFSIAKEVIKLCKALEIEKVWAILNKVQSGEMKSVIMGELRKRNVKTIGTIYQDNEVIKSVLKGNRLGKCEALQDVKRIVQRLEDIV
jgi:CO dehydrogenase maturation factor